jgi:hypothetical protein
MRVAFAHPGNYDCRLGIYVGSVMPPDGANTEFGIVQRLIKLGSLTGCEACNKKACFLLAANREGGRVLPGGASLSYRSIGVLEKKKFRNFRNSSGVYRRLGFTGAEDSAKSQSVTSMTASAAIAMLRSLAR